MKVPWERVFIAGDVKMCQKLVGLAAKIAIVNGIDGIPQIRGVLGQLAAEEASVEAFVTAMEVKGARRHDYFIPDGHMLYAAQVLTQQLYPKIIHTLRDLAGARMIMLPSGIEDLNDPEIADYVLRPHRSAVLEPKDRIKFFKLAWDAVGSEFASRHMQYEMFYAGADFVTKGHSYRTYHWDGARALVDRLLSSLP